MKHSGSRRLASWRDPTGREIGSRTSNGFAHVRVEFDYDADELLEERIRLCRQPTLRFHPHHAVGLRQRGGHGKGCVQLQRVLDLG